MPSNYDSKFSKRRLSSDLLLLGDESNGYIYVFYSMFINNVDRSFSVDFFINVGLT